MVNVGGDQVVQRQAAEVGVQGQYPPMPGAPPPHRHQLPVQDARLGLQRAERGVRQVPGLPQWIAPRADQCGGHGLPPRLAAGPAHASDDSR